MVSGFYANLCRFVWNVGGLCFSSMGLSQMLIDLTLSSRFLWQL